jgi:hypothetical protein
MTGADRFSRRGGGSRPLLEEGGGWETGTPGRGGKGGDRFLNGLQWAKPVGQKKTREVAGVRVGVAGALDDLIRLGEHK